MATELNYNYNPLRVEHYQEIKTLLENYWSLYDTQRIKWDYEMIVRIESITEQLDMIIEDELENQ